MIFPTVQIDAMKYTILLLECDTWCFFAESMALIVWSCPSPSSSSGFPFRLFSPCLFPGSNPSLLLMPLVSSGGQALPFLLFEDSGPLVMHYFSFFLQSRVLYFSFFVRHLKGHYIAYLVGIFWVILDLSQYDFIYLNYFHLCHFIGT